jgi:autotransporter-associated beta strand protein
VVTLNSVATPAQAAGSSIGKPNSIANGTIKLGNLTTTGQLTVVGTGETTDRVISLAGRTGGGTIDQSGTGLLKFTSDFTAPGANSTDERKTLTLKGSTAGTGEIAGAIVDSVLGTAGLKATSLVKTGTGTWTLSGVNTYTGTTSVTGGGTLIVSSQLGSGNVSVASGAKLQIDATGDAHAIADTANLTLASGSTTTLNFSGFETVGMLKLGTMTYLSGNFSAANGYSAYFAGPGTITATPEPASLGLLGLGAIGLLSRRRRSRVG